MSKKNIYLFVKSFYTLKIVYLISTFAISMSECGLMVLFTREK